MQSAQFQAQFRHEPTHWWFVARRKIITALISQVLPPGRSSWIVDVGCGTGGNIGSLSARYACTGIDQSAEAIQLARTRFPDVRFLCGDALAAMEHLAPRTSLVLLTDVLEHVADDRAMLGGLVRAALPGTYFLVTVPADRSLWSPHDQSHGHWRRYDLPGLERVWEGLPVKTLLLSHFNARLYPVVKLARMLSRWRGKTAGEAGTDLKMPGALVNRILERVFQGESKVLIDLLQGKRRAGYGHGVSLIALLRREASVGIPALVAESAAA